MRKFKKDLSALELIYSFVEKFCEGMDVPRGVMLTVYLATEELFTNMVKYASESTEDVAIELDRVPGRITVQLTDFRVPAFDLTLAPEADTALPLMERKIGGLGIHLTREMMDDVRYQHVDGNNQIVLIKNLR